MDRLYDDVLAFEESLGARFDYVLHVGDFGVWPNPDRVDKATRKHDGAGDFPVWFAGNRAAPRPTVFITDGAALLILKKRSRAATRLADRLYLFESLDDSGFKAELPVDECGVVLDYPDLFRRVIENG
jgi:hypothetical protein